MEIHDGRSLLLLDRSLFLGWWSLRVLRGVLGHLVHLLMHLLLLLMLLLLMHLLLLLLMLMVLRQLLVLLLLLRAQMLCPLDSHELAIQLRIPWIRVRLALSLHQRPFLHRISTHRYSPNCRGPYLHHGLHLVTSQVGRQHILRRSTSHRGVWLRLLLLLLRLLRPVGMELLVRCLHILLSPRQNGYNTVCTSAATWQAGPGPTGGGRDAVLWLPCRACGLVCACWGWC
jgi:hypothetical protein